MRRFNKDEYLVFYQGIREELHAKYQNYDLIILRDYNLSDGIRALASPIRNDYLDQFIKAIDLSGSESIIYFDPHDDYSIYKLNDPDLKLNKIKFNDYLFNLILQDWLFPELSYTIIGRVNDKILLQQPIAVGKPASSNQIKLLMESSGFKYAKGEYYLDYLNGVIKISDANPRNVFVKNNQLLGFDCKFELLIL